MKALCQQKEAGRRWGGSVSGFDLTPNCFSSEDDQGYLCEGRGRTSPCTNKVKGSSSRALIRLTRLLC